MSAVARAIANARALAGAPGSAAPPSPLAAPRVRVAMGDPQAPLERVLTVLDAHGLLGDDGWLRDDVRLASLGDHFDWGGTAQADDAAADGLALLAWLAAHHEEQVGLVAGNHDLARVGELAPFDDVTFAHARADAARVYRAHDPREEAAFRARWPALPGSEIAARDFAAFSSAQRDLVLGLLRSGRMRAAIAVRDDVLLLHAGVTCEDLARAGIAEGKGAAGIAAALDARLLEAAQRFDGTPMHVRDLHRPGDAAFGEGMGIFFHRAARPDAPGDARFEGHWRRRFDPRDLPRGLTQIIGHVRDSKCRSLLGAWADAAAATDGVLRTLRSDGESVQYTHGTQRDRGPRGAREAELLYADGAMMHIPEGRERDYELVDLATLAPLAVIQPA